MLDQQDERLKCFDMVPDEIIMGMRCITAKIQRPLSMFKPIDEDNSDCPELITKATLYKS